MATTLLPDPLDLLRRVVAQLENPANLQRGRGPQGEPVAKALQQLLSVALASGRVRAAAVDGVVRALNLPTGDDFAELLAVLRRIEDKLDRLVPADAGAATPPGRTPPGRP
ncbi:MAG: hypothetical protein J0L57_06385, partial [Burkholderiales bacterium]|nr:hypothetical protein [Burkholderiales bacterium]